MVARLDKRNFCGCLLVTYRNSSLLASHRKTTKGGERQKNTLSWKALHGLWGSGLSWSSWMQNKEKEKQQQQCSPLLGHAPSPWLLLSIISSDPHSSSPHVSTKFTREPLHTPPHEYRTFCFLPLEKGTVITYLCSFDRQEY